MEKLNSNPKKRIAVFISGRGSNFNSLIKHSKLKKSKYKIQTIMGIIKKFRIKSFKKINSIILLEDKILFKNPSNFSKPIAKIKEGRLLLVQKCDGKWCKVKTKKISLII